MLYLNVDPVAAVAEARNVRSVRSRIGYFGLTPARVCFEILEGACDDEGLLVDAVAAYREMGVAIAMDDFGAARSNFDRVASLRPDFVKLDRSLLTDAVGDAKARRMLPAVISILHATGTRVVIEGIEDGSAALVAIEAGADYLQGYHLAMPAAKLPDDRVSERMLSELVRVRSVPPVMASEALAEAGPGSGAMARLIGAARRSLPTLDSLPAYRVPPVEAVE
jgi:EAL domain-containing protein (putative c-di-GMP-specific phosphodiesterase class I)